MVKLRTRRSRSDPEKKTYSFMQRLKEIGMFFEKESPQHRAMRRLALRLRRAGIPYAVVGAMAVNAHGAERTTNDVDVLLTTKGFDQFKDEFIGKFYQKVEGRPRRFVEKQSKVRIDVLLTGLYPGSGEPGPIVFPDPEKFSEEIEKVRVLSLDQLIQLKLAARRHKDFADVVFLIQVYDLNESFLIKLHKSVHQDFIECLEEKRREDEYDSLE